MLEVADAFDFTLVGVEDFPTGPPGCWRRCPVPATFPVPLRACVSAMRGKLWIDQKDLQWVKAEAVATQDVSFGFFVARLSQGSRIVNRADEAAGRRMGAQTH